MEDGERGELLGPLTLRCHQSSGQWWALNKRETGWASSGYVFGFLGDALDAFDAKLVGFGVDRHGLYLTAVAAKSEAAP